MAQQRHIATWKRRAVVVVAAAFGGLWALAFLHPVGVTARGGQTNPSAQAPGGQVPGDASGGGSGAGGQSGTQANPNQQVDPNQQANPFFGGGGFLGGGGQAPILNSSSS